MLEFSIIIPIFNEKKNIFKLVEDINNNLIEAYKYEIIVVNDCSDDLLDEDIDLLEDLDNTKIITHKINMGQSFAIKNGIQNSKFKTIITIDGDLQNDPRDISKLIKIYQENNNFKLVGGIRKNRKDSLVKILSSKLANYVRSKILKDRCLDTGCSLKVFDRDIFLQFPFFNGIHRFLPALFLGYGHDTTFTEVNHRHRTGGKSKYGTIERLYRGIIDIVKVKKIINKQKYQ